MSTTNKIRLFQVVLANGHCTSPYVWRIRYALAHKGISFESVPIGLTEIPSVLGGRFKTVPVIAHDETMLGESWDIAEYLDRAFPRQPALFSGPAERAMVRLAEAWFSAQILPMMFRMYVLDAHNAVRPEDRSYFRQSREKLLKGMTLEAFTAERATRLPALREALTPLRSQLSRFPFLGGDNPNYADYIVLGAFQWIASVSTLPLLERSDNTLRTWLEQGFDLYNGLGRDSRMNPLYE